jgi:hypothetical protein
VCLRYHDSNMGFCEVPRSIGLKAKHDAIERKAATAVGDRFVSMNAWVCPYELCPVVVDHVLMWRDRHHMTVTFAKSLHRALYSILRSDLSETTRATNAPLVGPAL